MATPNRVGQINGEITRILCELLPGVKDPRVAQGLVSVVRVDTTSDLSLCRVYVSAVDGHAELLKGLRSASGFLRRELGARLGLRHTPALEFISDHSIETGARILGILEKIEKEDGRQ